MNRDLWKRVEEVFERASALPSGVEREVFLNSVEPEVGSEVRGLLAVADEDGKEIFFSLAAEAGSLVEQQTGGMRFGPWQVVETIGQGGMGAVYRGMRNDRTFDKQVAIKVMHLGLESAAGGERFRQERQILAGLEHPSIARLIDGGETENGLPYIVLEYVDGVDLLTFCQHLDQRAKLKLFLEVCAAVQYAHRNLVVHRDLKPGNILVGPEGKPKLLDFGIAKLIDADPARTATVVQALTPNYASPEQVRGQPITTASDVYSLGVVLYELLTNRPPYRITSHSPMDIDRVVCETVPDFPGLGNDLDNIIMMALRKEPERRYASVQQMAEDIERSLESRPVIARPDTLRYRISKFVERNRLGIAAAVVVALALTGGVVTSLYQARKAERRFQQVRRLANRFLFDFDQEIQPLAGSTKARQMLVSTALEYLGSLSSEAGGDLDLKAEIAAAYEKVGDVQGSPSAPSLGDSKGSAASYERARAMWSEVIERRPSDAKALRSITQALLKRADVEMRGDRTQVEPLLRKAVSYSDRARQAVPADADVNFVSAGVWFRLGEWQRAESQARLAYASFERALTGYEGAFALKASNRFERALAITQGRLAIAALEFDDPRRAMTHQQVAIGIQEKLFRLHPEVAEYKRGLATGLAVLGDIYSAPDVINLGDLKQGEACFRRSMQLMTELSAADQKNAVARVDVLLSRFKLADVIVNHAAQEAAALAQAGIDAAGADPTIAARTDVQEYVARCWRSLARAQLATNQLEPALRAARMARERFAQLDGKTDVARTELLLGDILTSLGKHAEAKAIWQQGYLFFKAKPLENRELVELRDGALFCARLGFKEDAAEIQAEWTRRKPTVEWPLTKGSNAIQ